MLAVAVLTALAPPLDFPAPVWSSDYTWTMVAIVAIVAAVSVRPIVLWLRERRSKRRR